MTADQIYTAAIAFISEKPQGNETKGFALHWLSSLLCEALPYENAIREGRGEALLPTAPLLTSWEEEIGYHDSIVRIALPFGLAAYLFTDDDNDYRSQDFRGRFINALREATPGVVGEIGDVYREEG